MIRRPALPVLAAVALALTAGAARAGEGVYIALEGGYGFWNKDAFKSNLARQVGNDPVSGLGNASLLVDRQLPDGGLFGLRLGYNIAGHIAFEGNLTVRPYDLLADTRGAAGFAGLAARWFPLQGLVRSNRQFDLSLLGGMDYVLTGGGGIHNPVSNTKLDNTGRGFDGVAVELGGTLELYPAKWVSLGLTPRIYFIDPIRYFTNFDHSSTGGALPITGKSDLTFFSISASVTFHFEPQPG